MSNSTTSHTRMAPLAVAPLRPRSLACLKARHAHYVLDLLGQVRPRAHVAMELLI
jgi:hypothetical protein